jgi:hypothetical protein
MPVPFNVPQYGRVSVRAISSKVKHLFDLLLAAKHICFSILFSWNEISLVLSYMCPTIGCFLPIAPMDGT